MNALPWIFALIRCLLPRKHRAERFPRVDQAPEKTRHWSTDVMRQDQRQRTR